MPLTDFVAPCNASTSGESEPSPSPKRARLQEASFPPTTSLVQKEPARLQAFIAASSDSEGEGQVALARRQHERAPHTNMNPKLKDYTCEAFAKHGGSTSSSGLQAFTVGSTCGSGESSSASSSSASMRGRSCSTSACSEAGEDISEQGALLMLFVHRCDVLTLVGLCV